MKSLDTSLYLQAIKTTTEAMHLENLIVDKSRDNVDYKLILVAREIVTNCIKLEVELARIS